MYKIITLNEKEIAHFEGKIIQVIDSVRKPIAVGEDYFGFDITSYMWVLTCLVEVKEDE